MKPKPPTLLEIAIVVVFVIITVFVIRKMLRDIEDINLIQERQRHERIHH